MIYAQIQNGLCIAISQLAGPVELPDMVAIDSYDENLIGKAYDPGSGEFSAPAPPALPVVVITSISVSPEHAERAQIAPDFTALKLPVGATVTIQAELQLQGQRIPGFTGEFALPLRSSDGLMRYLDVQFVDGRTTFVASMNDSKRWEVTRDLVNSNLPAEAHMDFAGIVITAVE